MPSSPSTLISEALNTLSKATNTALANVEDHARTQVERANAEVMEARAERDDALNSLHELELEQKELQRHAEGWKAAVEKSELTIKHQAETITHLRAEVQQWKTQLQRLEEASRQELLDWKEQYLRAEQERCRLSTRIDELVAEQLAWNTQANATLVPVTPRTHYRELTEPSTVSTATKRASTSSLPALSSVPHKRVTSAIHHEPPPKKSKSAAVSSRPTTQESISTQPPRHTAANSTVKAAPKATATPRRPSSAPRATREPPTGLARQQVIRHVRAVIQVPVKEEEYSDEDGLISDGFDASDSALDLDGASTSNNVSRSSQRTKPRKKSMRDDDDSGDQADRSNTNGHRSRRIMSVEDDIDELAMGAEDDVDDEYLPPQTGRASVAKAGDSTTPARLFAQKRKLHADGNSTGRRTATKTPRKK